MPGHIEIQDGGCGIASSSGTLKMTPLWKKFDAEGKVSELFEGTRLPRVMCAVGKD